ncbi:polysaccharide biosynthesis protein [Methylonatrum kenyense]|uniref:polysaccharide biosynthesis protein n=1 Tax=Methylonatrum kenyense TaxID=455253 RepID=UPI0020BF948E|nr:nucleoside-diphosphate sugar epimerase/dehydratase [Methylonatrum kenyense]MCK8516952.1 polysaccharide biosynthesis protein [Methylonatrum kenyense]
MSLTARLAKLPRPAKKSLMVATDLVMLPIAVWAAFMLRLGEAFPPVLVELWWLLIAVPLLSLPCLASTGLYRSVVRYMGPQAVWAVVKGTTVAAICFAALVTLARLDGVPRTTFWLFWMMALLGVGGTRILARMWFQSALRSVRIRREPVAVYGAGNAGVQLAAALESGREYQPKVFVDDNRSMQGTLVNGLRVHHPTALKHLIQKHRISSVLLALPSLSRHRRRQIVESLEELPVQVKTVPTVTDLVAGHARIDDIREVGIDDLLGRDPVKPSMKLLNRCIKDRRVLVTGAGGSIGSELCRQILRRNPRTLVMLDQSEVGLYQIERELEAIATVESLDTSLVPLLGNVQDETRLRRIMKEFAVETVYHSAAYKHVPIVEQNLLEGVKNNVFGTQAAASAAIASGVRWFVLVSTDKAVRPTNVMGASKRLAELTLQALAADTGSRTVFSMVRFGNVLDSSGSVVPIFRDQIRRGGPVTVTHRDMTRYFMTIPEAASLVIQAGAMAQGGDVFVLDMGEPVKVLDLAQRMIRLSGLQVRDKGHPEGDIEIKFTGIRPGEKLFEELLIGENVTGTDHPMIMRAKEKRLPKSEIDRVMAELRQAAETFDCNAAHLVLQQAVDGFDSRHGVSDTLWRQSLSTTPEAVIPFPADRHSRVD